MPKSTWDFSSAIAYGYFDDTVQKTGSGYLFIHTNKGFTDKQQLSCAGYLEGMLRQSETEAIKNELDCPYMPRYGALLSLTVF